MHRVYPLPPPSLKNISSNHCFQFLLGITVIPGEIEDNGSAQGALWSIWKWWIYSFMLENFGFFVFSKWHKIQLLLQQLEVTFKNASNVTWLTWTYRFKKRIFWTGTGLRSRLVIYTFNMLSLFTTGRISKRQSYGDVRG